MNAHTPHRASLTVLVALTAALVVAGIIAGSPVLDQHMRAMSAIPTDSLAIGFAAVSLLGLAIWCVAQLGRAARTRARRVALASSVRGELSCGIRHGLLVQGLNELRPPGSNPVRLGARYSIIVDDHGVAFWNGGRRPRRAIRFAWPEVRAIRADSMVVGGSAVPVLELRVRRNGASVELPIILAAGRPGRYALADAPFFAVVRSWKATHRAALAREGLELPPLTAPIPIISPEMAAAGRR